MKAQPSKDRAETRVIHKYHKLYMPLMELVDALQDLEPGGTLVDDTVIMKNDEKIRIAYAARPVMLTIKDKDRMFILRVVEGNSA